MTYDKMILGENTFVSTDSRATGVNNNVLVCGGTGCGKTMSVSEPALLETSHANMIVTLTKRRLADQYKSLFQERGYRVLDLNFADPAAGSVCYDPIGFVRSERDAAALAEAVMGASGRVSTDPYWENAAVALLTAEIGAVMGMKKHPCFRDVIELNNQLRFVSGQTSRRANLEDLLWDADSDPRIRRTERPQKTATASLDGYFKALDEKDPGSYLVSCWRSFREMPDKTARCIFGTLTPVLNRMFPPAVLEMMTGSPSRQLDLRRFADERSILFVTSQPGANQGLQQLIALFYSQVFSELFALAEARSTRRLPRDVRILCDDFAAGGRIRNFAENISVFREKGISVTLLIQSESQLEALYGEADATTIINNCDTYLYMGGMDASTALGVSRKIDRPLEEILWMPVGTVWVMRRGQKPVKTKRYDIQSDERWKRLKDSREKGRERSR